MGLNFEKDENGLYILSKGTDPWDQGMDANFKMIGEDLAKKVNKTPPQKYDLALAQGIVFRNERENYLYKTQEGVVGIVFSCVSSSGNNLNNGSPLFTLPVGFRPKGIVYCTTSLMKINETYQYYNHAAGFVRVFAGGNVDVLQYQSNDMFCGVNGTVLFLAEQAQ